MRECDWVPGCFYLVRREVIDRVGLFDPRYFLYCEEVDHCRAVRRAGWSVVYYPFTQVRAHRRGERTSAGPVNRVGRQISALQVESELLYFRKHHGVGGALAAGALAMATLGCAVVGRQGAAARARARAGAGRRGPAPALAPGPADGPRPATAALRGRPVFDDIRADPRAHAAGRVAVGGMVVIAADAEVARVGLRTRPRSACPP